MTNLNSKRENELRKRVLISAEGLPEKDEIIICEGILLIDADGPVTTEEVGEQVGCSILCG